MNKYSYFVINEQELETGKHLARYEKVHNCNNLLGHFTPCKGFQITSINACDTFKDAKEIADFWNDCYKKNGTYVFA